MIDMTMTLLRLGSFFFLFFEFCRILLNFLGFFYGLIGAHMRKWRDVLFILSTHTTTNYYYYYYYYYILLLLLLLLLLTTS